MVRLAPFSFLGEEKTVRCKVIGSFGTFCSVFSGSKFRIIRSMTDLGTLCISSKLILKNFSGKK